MYLLQVQFVPWQHEKTGYKPVCLTVILVHSSSIYIYLHALPCLESIHFSMLTSRQQL